MARCTQYVAGQQFSPGTSASSTNNADHHDITEMLLQVGLNTITHKPNQKNTYAIYPDEMMFEYNIKS